MKLLKKEEHISKGYQRDNLWCPFFMKGENKYDKEL